MNEDFPSADDFAAADTVADAVVYSIIKKSKKAGVDNDLVALALIGILSGLLAESGFTKKQLTAIVKYHHKQATQNADDAEGSPLTHMQCAGHA